MMRQDLQRRGAAEHATDMKVWTRSGFGKLRTSTFAIWKNPRNRWIESVLQIFLPPSTELKENLRNGVVLTKLGHLIAPKFRHTDNINKWIASLTAVKLPETFFPETTDVYYKKNMPRVIYCIHALSTHLFCLGKTPAMSDVYGRIVITAMVKST
ncbi:Hypothetical predicted protein [Cloeon dipterum]|uniref:Calponin-homology (CH) domain-containing protein n=1 Tax=Cloeon dipterum TaxID=197152 RepID=A0A8S1C629_9INSE|nr:Hypothetical predicted protein [Cloeon dipterum]